MKGTWFVKLERLISCKRCNKYLENNIEFEKHKQEHDNESKSAQKSATVKNKKDENNTLDQDSLSHLNEFKVQQIVVENNINSEAKNSEFKTKIKHKRKYA